MLLTPTVGVPPLPIGAYKLTTMQRQGLKLLTSLPGAALLSQRDKIIEAFEPVFEASPYTMIANVTGQPSMSLPLHWTDDGLPMGMLFTARIGDEATLFRLAAQLEQAMPWASASRRTRSPELKEPAMDVEQIVRWYFAARRPRPSGSLLRAS